MKRTKIIIICAVLTALIISLAACGKNVPGEGTSEDASASISSSDAVPASDTADTPVPASDTTEAAAPKPDPAEIALNINPATAADEAQAYHETVVHGDDKSALDKETSKTGMFCILRDQFNERDRYYVWGYGDSERSADWQWEFNPKNVSALPAQGSIITVTGKLVNSDDALDRIWINDAEIEVKTNRTPDAAYDVDCRFMGSTLERVQVQNINLFAEYFEGKTVAVYGRALSTGSIRNPYDGDAESIVEWSMEFVSEYKNPEEGTLILLTGTVADGYIEDGVVSILN